MVATLPDISPEAFNSPFDCKYSKDQCLTENDFRLFLCSITSLDIFMINGRFRAASTLLSTTLSCDSISWSSIPAKPISWWCGSVSV